ncbi:MAG: extracellular solute-binding protein [Pseudohongiellaceae bacterium]
MIFNHTSLGAMCKASLAAVALLVAGSVLAQDLTVVSWGGAYSEAQRRAYREPYMALNPEVNIINDDSSAEAVAKLRAMNEAGNITWDAVDVVAADAIRLCDEGLVMVINPNEDLAAAPDGTSPMEDFGEEWLLSECLAPHVAYSTTFAYRTDLVGDTPPDELCDVFDLEAYPGRRALERRPINNMEWALLCDGVAAEDVYDVLATNAGQDQALAKLSTIKDEVIWWSAGANTPQLLADGEVVIGSGYNGRLFALIEEQKQPVSMLWDGQILDFGGWVIPAGLSEERAAQALNYVSFATGTQQLADQAAYISYAPIRTSALELVGQHADLGIDMMPHMPTAPANSDNTFTYDYEFWADFRDDIDDKFQAWLLQ